MGVLLGFCETKVFDAKTREHVGENVLVLARWEGDRQRKRDVVNREADEIDRRSIRNRKLVKTCDSQHSRDLARAVGTKVEKYYSVAILNGRYRLAALINDNYGFNKFVGHAALVRFFDRLDGIIGSLPHGIDQQIVSALSSLPAPIAIHRVVAAHHRGDLTATNPLNFLLQSGDVIGSG